MYLGIDIGTSGVKAVLIDAEQTVVASGSAALEVSRPHPGWSEQDPESWWTAARASARRAARDRGGRRARGAVAGIGLSGHMHGATLLDAADRPLRPCILWNDVRSAEEAAELDARPAVPRDHRQHRLPRLHRAEARLGRASTSRRSSPRSRKVLLPKDYVRLKLTGDYASDMSDCRRARSGSTSARATGATTLLAATGLVARQMPQLFEGSAATGTLRRSSPQRWGMAAAPVVAGGGGDNAASACGVGVVRPGSAFVSLGTSGVLFVSNARFSPDPETAVHAFCHAVPDTWHQMGVILSAAGALDWLAERLRDRRRPS